jgi:hypothetical protein
MKFVKMLSTLNFNFKLIRLFTKFLVVARCKRVINHSINLTKLNLLIKIKNLARLLKLANKVEL